MLRRGRREPAARHRDRLDRLAHALLETETLDEDEAYAAAGIDRRAGPGALARGEVPGVPPAPGIPPREPAGSGHEGLPIAGRQSGS